MINLTAIGNNIPSLGATLCVRRTQSIVERGRTRSRAKLNQLVVLNRESKAKEERREEDVVLLEKLLLSSLQVE